jgi:hypothetical protein
MWRRENLFVRIFRNRPGDLGIPDFTLSPAAAADPEQSAIGLLQGHHLSKQRPIYKTPTQAQLVGEDGRLISKFQVTPNGVEKVSEDPSAGVGS